MEYPRQWTCEVIELRIEAYLLRTLPRRDALAFAEHLEACPRCAEWVMLIVEIGITPGGVALPTGVSHG